MPLRRLQVGHHFRMGGALSFGEQRMGQLCAMIAASSGEQPVERAMFLGLGTGATMGAALDILPDTRADGVELVPEVLQLLHRFADINHDLGNNPRARLLPADARRFVVASPESHDLVLADLFHPGQDGAGSLYAEEHFLAVREHLRPGAPFCQWLPLYQLGPAELRGVVRTFLGVFPETHAFLGLYNASTPALALVGRVPTASAPQLRLDLERLRALTSRPGVTIVDPRDLLASYMAERTALASWAGEGPINTDLRPRVLFDAPAAAYADDARLGARNLESLLALRPADPAALLTGPGAEALHEPARRYAAAAALYLRAELARGEIGDLKQLPAEAAELAIQAYETDPEFAPARGSLYAIVRGNPQLAEQILPRMLARTPDEPRVHQALLAHLQSIGDRDRFEAALKTAQARFPQPPGP
jgi:spermidine synthase